MFIVWVLVSLSKWFSQNINYGMKFLFVTFVIDLITELSRLEIYFDLLIHLNYLTNDIDILSVLWCKIKKGGKGISKFSWKGHILLKWHFILKVTNEVSPYLGIAIG